MSAKSQGVRIVLTPAPQSPSPGPEKKDPPVVTKKETKTAIGPEQSVMVFTSPPGGVIDPKGVLANRVPITGATVGLVLTSNGVGASWESAGAGVGDSSVSAHWGESGTSILILPSGQVTLPIDSIDINPSGEWAIVPVGSPPSAGLEYSGSAGLFQISVAINAQNTGGGTTFADYCNLLIFNGVTQLASVPFLGGIGPSVQSSSILANISPGNIISVSVRTGTSEQSIDGDTAGSAPHNGIQYTIVRLA